MERTMRFYCFIFALHIFAWVGVRSRLLPPNYDDHNHHHMALSGTAQTPESQQSNLTQSDGTQFLKGEEQLYKNLGSRPPSCEHKCYGCMPCEPSQVPTDTVKPQYTNYEPLDWKCKCGPSFYSP